MTDIRRKSDHTGCVIIGFVIFGLFAIVFGAVVELLKFAALIKWVFS